MTARYQAFGNKTDASVLSTLYGCLAPVELGGYGEDHFLDPHAQLLHWKLISGGAREMDCLGYLSNAEGEEARLLAAFGAAARCAFPEEYARPYRDMVSYLANGLAGIGAAQGAQNPYLCGSFEGLYPPGHDRDDYLLQSCAWPVGHVRPAVTDKTSNVSYNNLFGYRNVTRLPDRWLSDFYTQVLRQTPAAALGSEWMNTGLFRANYDLKSRYFFANDENDTDPNLVGRGCTADASSVEGDLVASNAIDHNCLTRWGSAHSDGQSITVDLQREVPFNRIRLLWETAYASDYEIRIAHDWDPLNYEPIAVERHGDGWVDDIRFACIQSARFVRICCITRATEWGFSIFEIEVYNHDYRYCSSLDALDLACRAGRYAAETRDIADSALWEMARRTYCTLKNSYLSTEPGSGFADWYDVYTAAPRTVPTQPWLAGLADLVDLACLFRDYGFAQQVLAQKILSNQVAPGSGLSGALKYAGEGAADAFTNLELLSALRLYNSGASSAHQPYFDPPLWNRGFTEGETVTFTVSAVDPDGGHLTLTADALPPGAVFTDHGDGTGTFTWSPGLGDGGTVRNIIFEAEQASGLGLGCSQTLRLGNSVFGPIYASDGQPLEGADVAITDLTGRPVASGTTNGSGRFHVQSGLPGLRGRRVIAGKPGCRSSPG